MRNTLTAILTVLILLPALSRADETTEWTATATESGGIQYSAEGCTVTVWKRERGITFDAVDSAWREGPLVQTTILERQSDGGITIHRSASTSKEVNGLYWITSTQVSPYDVFYVNCRKKARHLPREVRTLIEEKFGDFYALGRE